MPKLKAEKWRKTAPIEIYQWPQYATEQGIGICMHMETYLWLGNYMHAVTESMKYVQEADCTQTTKKKHASASHLNKSAASSILDYNQTEPSPSSLKSQYLWTYLESKYVNSHFVLLLTDVWENQRSLTTSWICACPSAAHHRQSSFQGLHKPQAIPKKMNVVNSNSFVDLRTASREKQNINHPLPANKWSNYLLPNQSRWCK